MASSKTPNLLLNQWALNDPVRHEDFNEDNLIVDDAIAQLKEKIDGAGTHLLMERTVTERVASVSVDLSGITLTDYQYVIIDIEGHLYTDGSAVTSDARFALDQNGTFGSGQNCRPLTTTSHTSGYMATTMFYNELYGYTGKMRVVLHTHFGECGYITSHAHTGGGSINSSLCLGTYNDARWSKVTMCNMYLSASGKMFEKLKFTVWGVK